MQPTLAPGPSPLAEIARRLAHGHKMDLIDVRTPLEFAEIHVAGSHLVPLDRLDPQAVLAERNGADREPLYVICRSGNRAAKAVERFQAAGFQNVVNIEGGMAAWVAAGLPVVRGATKMISLERQVRIGAGVIVLLGVLLGLVTHPAFFGIAAFAGAGLVFAGITDWCGMGLLLGKMPWNRSAGDRGGTSTVACSR